MGLISRLRTAMIHSSLSREEVFDLARQDRYTGAVTFHFRDGKARSVATGPPLQAELVEEEDTESGKPLGMPLTGR